MVIWNDIGEPLFALDDFEVNDQGRSDNAAAVSVAPINAHNLIRLAAWDDSLGLDVDLLLALPNAKALRDRLIRAIGIIEARNR
jgi:hypothetical protein